MIANYQVRFKDVTGSVTHVMAGTGSIRGGLESIQYENVVNGVPTHAIRISGDAMSDGLEIGLDYQVEIWKRVSKSVDWTLMYEGFHRTWVWQASGDGSEAFTSYGSGYTSLLARRIIAAYAGTAGSNKTGKAEAVMKAFVNENAGPGAGARALPGLTVQVSGGNGNDWHGARSWNNLLEVCQDIANTGGGDFNVVGTGPATFEFRWYTGQIGADRTIGNLAGNDPAIFSLQRNNMLTPVLSLNHGQEFNYIYVLGQGEGVARMVVAAYSAAAVAASPWNRVEVARQATNEDTTDGLATVGSEEVVNGASRESVSFEVAQTPSSAYGTHYGLGDIVTALYHQRVDKKIVKASIVVNKDGESVNLELADVR